MDDSAKANVDDDMSERGGGQQDDIMDHDKRGDVPKSTGQTSQTSDATMCWCPTRGAYHVGLPFMGRAED